MASSYSHSHNGRDEEKGDFGDISLGDLGDTTEFMNPQHADTLDGNGHANKGLSAAGVMNDPRKHTTPHRRATITLITDAFCTEDEGGLHRALTSRHITFIGFGGGM